MSAASTIREPGANSAVVRALFAAGETMNVHNFAKFYAEGAPYQFSNFPVVYGPQGVIDSSAGFIATVKNCYHHIENLWEIDDETVVCEMTVTYERFDGKSFTLPCCDTIKIRDGKVASLRIYMNIDPVFVP